MNLRSHGLKYQELVVGKKSIVRSSCTEPRSRDTDNMEVDHGIVPISSVYSGRVTISEDKSTSEFLQKCVATSTTVFTSVLSKDSDNVAERLDTSMLDTSSQVLPKPRNATQSKKTADGKLYSYISEFSHGSSTACNSSDAATDVSRLPNVENQHENVCLQPSNEIFSNTSRIYSADKLNTSPAMATLSSGVSVIRSIIGNTEASSSNISNTDLIMSLSKAKSCVKTSGFVETATNSDAEETDQSFAEKISQDTSAETDSSVYVEIKPILLANNEEAAQGPGYKEFDFAATLQHATEQKVIIVIV